MTTSNSDAIAVRGDHLEHCRLAEMAERDAWLDFFASASTRVRDAFGLASHRIGGVALLASRAVPITEFNRAMAVGVEEALTDDRLDMAATWLDRYASPGWALQIPPFALSADLASVSQARGLEPSGAGWAKFVRRLSPATVWAPSSDADVRIVGVDSAAVFGTMIQSGFGLPDESAAWFAGLAGRPGWRCFLATLDGAPAGAAASFENGRASWFGMSATLPAFRRRGVQSALIAGRLRSASDQGLRLVTSETARPASDEDATASSFRNQARAGFEEVYARQNFKRPAHA